MLNELLDIEVDLREAEGALRCGFRHLNCCKDEGWFDLMEEFGFLINGSFLPILKIIEIASKMDETNKVFTLESVACDLSKIAQIIK